MSFSWNTLIAFGLGWPIGWLIGWCAAKYISDYFDKKREKEAAIESLLQQLPEVQAAVFICMWDEYQAARLQGKRPSDLWNVNHHPER